MTDKIEVNIVYGPGSGPPKQMYENERGVIWLSNKRDPNKFNIGMGWYSIKDPNPGDSILVVEPYCVLQRDYDINFVKQFKYIFTWATNAMTRGAITNKVVPINHPTYHNIPDLSERSGKWTPWNERANEIVIIANNKSSEHHTELYSLRVHLADMLDAFSSYKVSWYGQIPLKRPYYRGTIQDKQAVLSKVKFSICTENSYDKKYTHNYFTEKMPDVWKAGAVPIYIGCFNINDMGALNGCYIDLRPLIEKAGKSWKVNKQALNDRIVNFNEQNYADYKTNLNDHVVGTGLLEKYHSYPKVYETIIDTFYKENNPST